MTRAYVCVKISEYPLGGFTPFKGLIPINEVKEVMLHIRFNSVLRYT